jgi:hypothetical protein
MHMGMAGVVMIHRRPLQREPEIPLHGVHDPPRELPQVEPVPVLGREHHFEKQGVPSPVPARERGAEVDLRALGIEAAPRAVLLRAVALQIRTVLVPGAG